MGNKIYVGGKKKKPVGRRYRPGSQGRGRVNPGLLAAAAVTFVIVLLVVLLAAGVIKLPGTNKPVAAPAPSPTAAPVSSQEVSQQPEASSSEETSSQEVNSRVTDPSLSYQLLYPELYVDPVEIVPRVENDKVVFFTFNDAPSGCTQELLDLLDRLQVKATFFVTAANMKGAACKDMLKTISDRGHTLGIYSYSGDYTTVYASVESYLEDFKKCDDLIFEATGKHAHLFRFPAGSGDNAYNNGLSQALVDEMTRRGYVYHDWNVDSSDVSGSSGAEELARSTVERCLLNEKNVVLMNNSGVNASTVEAVRLAVERLREEGYRFAALDPTVKPFVF